MTTVLSDHRLETVLLVRNSVPFLLRVLEKYMAKISLPL